MRIIHFIVIIIIAIAIVIVPPPFFFMKSILIFREGSNNLITPNRATVQRCIIIIRSYQNYLIIISYHLH